MGKARILVAAAAATALGSSALASVVLEQIIKRFDPVPNTPLECWPAFAFDNPKIDNSGKVVFTGIMDNSGACGGTAITGNRRGLYYGGPGTVMQLARDGVIAGFPFLPNLNGWRHNTTTSGAGLVTAPTIAPNGTIMCSSSLNGVGATTTNNTTFWTGISTNLQQVAQRGFFPNPIAASPLTIWNTNLNLGTSQFDVNNAGQVIFNSNLTGGDTITSLPLQNNTGVWLGNSTLLSLVMRQGDVAPGLGDPEIKFGAAPTFGTRLNGLGQAIFGSKLRITTLSATPVTTANDDVLYKWSAAGGLTLIARQGTPAARQDLLPGTTYPTTTFSPFSPISFSPLNNNGKILYTANLTGAVTVGVDDSVTYLTTDGTDATTSIVFRKGQAATVEGSVLAGTVMDILNTGNTRLNNNDTVLMTGVYRADAGLPTPIDNTNNDFMYCKPATGPTQLILRAGDLMNLTSAGLPSDAVWNFESAQAGFGMNNLDTVVFTSDFTGTGVTPGTDSNGIFAWKRECGIIFIARTGTIFDPSMGAATALTIDSRGNGEGGCAGFSDTDWLTFRIQDAFGNQAIYRTMVMCPPVGCDSIDFNNDGVSPDSLDLTDFLSVYGGGPCSNDPLCGDIDFNNDGVSPDSLDIDKLLEVYGGGNC